MKALIALEDGTCFEGRSAGLTGETEGELVFNTSMTGYQEILTDPSYRGQIVTMTYPLIGNYGVNEEDVESGGPKVAGFIAREFSKITSNHRATEGLLDYLSRHGIMAIEEVDTRALTKHIREKGAMKAMVSTADLDRDSLVARAGRSTGILGIDLVAGVTCPAPYVFEGDGGDFTVVVMDFGVKTNIPRMLKKAGCRVMSCLRARPPPIFSRIARRRPFVQRPGRPRRGPRYRRGDKEALRQNAYLRHLLRPAASRPCVRGQDVQAEVRPQGRQPARERAIVGQGRHHIGEPWVRGRY